MIKYWEYSKEYKNLRSKILYKIDKVFKSGKLFFGKELLKFENIFLRYNKANYGLGVGNGTDALIIALKSFDIGSGDEVITVANTAIPTIAAIVNVGAKPVFVDVNENYLIDVSKIESKITKNTKAIIPVHLFGQMCDMKKIIAISKKYKLLVIEDCAQSCGAIYKNKKSGTIGDAGTFSFYPTKVLGSYADAGFIIYKKKKFFQKARRLRFYGLEINNKKNKWNNKYYSFESGINSRLNEIQSCILNIKIKFLEKFIKQRIKIANFYSKNLKNLELNELKPNKDNRNVFHIYPILVNNRDKLIRRLKEKKINVNVNYPIPIHKMKAYKKFVCEGCDCLTFTEKYAKKLISLPIYPDLKNNALHKIVNEIKILTKKKN
jgi:aminotransferase EvaB